ncbi:MAG: WG repeat-containing protein [Deltaproteobacteria bacterium]|nr:WG repeat-containing protein [Deltaproteobacteria bacterium]
MSGTKTRLTFTEGASAKFWEIEIRGVELHIAWGKLGTAGQSQVKALASPEAAAKEAAKLIAEKTRKGYAPDPATPAPTQAAATDEAAKEEAAPAKKAKEAAPAKKAKEAAPAKKAKEAAPAKKAKGTAPKVPLWGGLAVAEGKVTPAFDPDFTEVRGGFRAEGLAAVRRDGKWGYIDRTGATRIPFAYDEAWWFEGGFACVRRADAPDVSAVDAQGKEHADYPLARSEGATIIIQSPQRNHQDHALMGRTRLVAADGRELGACTDPFSPILEIAPGWFKIDGSYAMGVPWRVLDREGRPVAALEGKSLDVFVEGRARVFGSTQSFVRLDGSALPGTWTSCQRFAEGFAAVSAGYRQAGFIDLEGQVLGALDYEETFSFDGGVARVKRRGGVMGLIDRTGAWRVPAEHRAMRPQAHGRVAGELQAGGWMLYDTASGARVLDAPYDDLVPLGAEPLYGVRRGKKWGVVDRDGRVLVPLEHDLVRAFGRGFVAVNRGANAKGVGGLWGVVDITGRLHVAPRYSDIGIVRDGVALVQEPPVDGAESWPFRFYGVNPAHWAEGANAGHVWRAHFTSTPWGEGRDRITVAIEGGINKGGAFAEIDWDGAFVMVRAGEKKGGARKLFAAVRKAFEEAHTIVPIAEVVFLGAQVGSVDDGQGADAWERWSLRQQAEVDGGPDFGLEGYLFSL